MIGFLLDEKGDVVIKNNEVVMTEGSELLAQTVRTTLATNKGEWFDNPDEGINYKVLLGKNTAAQAINRNENITLDKPETNAGDLSGDLSKEEEAKLATMLRRRLDGDT